VLPSVARISPQFNSYAPKSGYPIIARSYSVDSDHSSPFPTITKKELEKTIHASTKDNKKDYTLVDVRSQLEVDQTGKINTANVIPLPEIAAAFQLSDVDFEKKYGFPKFKKSDKVIFYCQSGKRSENACIAAQSAGFTNVHNYRGSAKEWFNL